MQFELFAACQPGLEPLLMAELQALGVAPRPLAGGVAFRGDMQLAQRCCLWLGTASHVLLRLCEMPCRALGELQRKAAQLPWRSWLRPAVPVRLHATSRGSRVYHTDAIVERLEQAIANAFGAPVRSPAAGDEAFATVHARFRDDVCTLSVDVTTTPLHRRGYRLDGRKAPLREDLAHALVLSSGWTADLALLDPFCGSGTIAIEAAALGLGLPPGRLRPPPGEHLALFDADGWAQVRGFAPRPLPLQIAASDRDEGAIAATRDNAERAGVAAHLDLRHAALSDQPWLGAGDHPAHGVVVTNPPFGRRIGGKNPLLPLYQTLGARIEALGDGWRAAILAHDVRLARRTALPLRAAFTTRHGGLSITALVTDPGAGADAAAGSATDGTATPGT